jgi:hypothetical protein
MELLAGPEYKSLASKTGFEKMNHDIIGPPYNFHTANGESIGAIQAVNHIGAEVEQSGRHFGKCGANRELAVLLDVPMQP